MRSMIPIIFLVLNYIYGVNLEFIPKSGPYVSLPVVQHECTNPSKPFEAVRSIILKAELVNGTTISRGNVSIISSKKWPNIVIKGRVYRREDNSWQIIKIMNSFGCRGLIISAGMRILGMKYDNKHCSAPQGIYHFNNLDVNRLEHVLWPSEREYGYYLWIFDVQTPTVTLICYQQETWVKPLKTRSSKRAKKTNKTN